MVMLSTLAAVPVVMSVGFALACGIWFAFSENSEPMAMRDGHL